MKPFAFISYSRKDSNVAIDLHKKIEKYAYPKEWVDEKNRPVMDDYVRPIFIDLADLSIKHRSFTDELKDTIANSRYLIVICSENSAKSFFVKREIDYFLKTHNNNADLIVAVYVDKIFSGLHPVIDEIVATRNCPIYVTGKGEAGHVGRKYCFYHILEFLLKVDFDKLYNRYEEYKKRKQRQKTSFITFIVAIFFSVALYGWYSQSEKTKLEHARVEFEMGVFPYSLVVGYVDNFLKPTLKVLNKVNERQPNMIIYMPYDSIELNHDVRRHKYDAFIMRHYEVDSFRVENINIPRRQRSSSVSKIFFKNTDIQIYKDEARTVSAFRSVIDYKLSSRNPVRVPREIRERFTQLYTDSFILYSQQKLGKYAKQVHFVRNTKELSAVLDSLLKYN